MAGVHTWCVLPDNEDALAEHETLARLGTWLSRYRAPRGHGYLRTLFIQAARVILLRPASWPKHSFGLWLARAAQRLHRNVLAAALANKLARIVWTVLAQERSYEARLTEAAA